MIRTTLIRNKSEEVVAVQYIYGEHHTRATHVEYVLLGSVAGERRFISVNGAYMVSDEEENTLYLWDYYTSLRINICTWEVHHCEHQGWHDRTQSLSKLQWREGLGRAGGGFFKSSEGTAVSSLQRCTLSVENVASMAQNFDVIVDMKANVNLSADLDLLQPSGGRIAIVGSQPTPPTVETKHVNPRAILTREAIVHGVFLWNLTKDERSVSWQRVLDCLTLHITEAVALRIAEDKEGCNASMFLYVENPSTPGKKEQAEKRLMQLPATELVSLSTANATLVFQQVAGGATAHKKIVFVA